MQSYDTFWPNTRISYYVNSYIFADLVPKTWSPNLPNVLDEKNIIHQYTDGVNNVMVANCMHWLQPGMLEEKFRYYDLWSICKIMLMNHV